MKYYKMCFFFYMNFNRDLSCKYTTIQVNTELRIDIIVVIVPLTSSVVKLGWMVMLYRTGFTKVGRRTLFHGKT